MPKATAALPVIVKPRTKSQETATDIAYLLRARTPLLWIVTREEGRVEEYLIESAKAASYLPRTWDIGQGAILTIGGTPTANTQNPDEVFALIKAYADRPATGPTGNTRERGVWFLRDLPPWLEGPGAALTVRKLRNLVKALPSIPREAAQAVIILSPSGNVPAELAGHTTVVEWPMPDRAEVASILGTVMESQPARIKETLLAMDAKEREMAVDAAVGLNGEEAKACYSKSLVRFRRIDPVAVSQEKRRVIAREGVLEWYDPLPGGLDAVGGLDNLKAWLLQRRLAYGPEARAYGLSAPKGTLLVGVSGCGKSLTAKATSTAFEVPLIRMDLGALKSKFVGDSEGNLRKAFDTIQAIGRCVVWLDEIEKALAGATQGGADGGVSSDQLGGILTWMEERRGEAFVIATANDVSALPPELLRKGRFDETWFVGLPNEEERKEILKAALRNAKRDQLTINVSKVAEVSDRFTGSEVASLVPDALFAAFAQKGREITTTDLVTAAKAVHPLSKTAKPKIDALYKWQEDYGAKAATGPIVGAVKTPVARRQMTSELDIEDNEEEVE